MNDLFVLSYSKDQKVYHIESIKEYNESSVQSLLQYGEIDFAAVFISTSEEVDKMSTLLDQKKPDLLSPIFRELV